MRSRLRLRLLLLPVLALAAAACTGTSGTAGPPERCAGFDLAGQSFEHSPCRVFRGRLRLPQQKQLTLPERPLQVVGVGFVAAGPAAASDGGPARDDSATTDLGAAPRPLTDQVAPRFFYGDPFATLEGGGLRSSTPFAVVVPCEISVNLLLQIPRTGGDRQPGLQVAAMAFAADSGSTTLIPRQSADGCAGKAADLDLGLVDLELSRRGDLSSGSITLGKGNSNNPLALVPTPESDDPDQDRDGDGILDTAQTLSALPDVLTPGVPPDGKPHPDGVADLFQGQP